MARHGKILVVDDDRAIRDATTLRLCSVGYETISACDGPEAIVLAIGSCPDAIVLDVRMQRMDGLTVLRQLRERDDTMRIPVVMLSASIQSQQVALDAGARFFVAKPYEGKTLVAAVDSAISEASDEE